ncbi:MAG: hypothetical protein QOK15_3784, partial [Nocardioidaceae bacterium]|nr:hypothetical protein [Nocardioidaceae bacterium]
MTSVTTEDKLDFRHRLETDGHPWVRT